MSYSLVIAKFDNRNAARFSEFLLKDKVFTDFMAVDSRDDTIILREKESNFHVYVTGPDEVFREGLKKKLNFDHSLEVEVPGIMFRDEKGKEFVRGFVKYLAALDSEDILVWYDFGQAVLYRKNGIVQLSSRPGVIPNLFDPGDFDSVQIVENLDIV